MCLGAQVCLSVKGFAWEGGGSTALRGAQRALPLAVLGARSVQLGELVCSL